MAWPKSFLKREKEKEKKVVEFSPVIMNRKYKERRQLTLCRMTYSKDLGCNGPAVVLGHVQTGFVWDSLCGSGSLHRDR